MPHKDLATRNKYEAKWRAANRGRIKVSQRKYNLLKKFNLTIEAFDAILLAQGGRCALFEICGSVQPNGPYNQWHVDHDHTTGKVRGLLCFNCNVNLVGANTALSVVAVAKYLGAVLQ